MNIILYYLKGLADLILPRECIVCGRGLRIWEEHLCTYCLADFPYTYHWMVSRNPMADVLNGLIAEDLEVYEPYSYAIALFFYHSEANFKYIPQAVKYHGNIRAGEFFGRMLAGKLAEAEYLPPIDLIIPVPLHKARQRQRGYNQAEIIARAIAKALHIPLCANLLRRCKRTKTQTQLDVEGKQENVKNAFEVDARVAARFSLRHIAVVDDVFTTGATMYACHNCLRRYFGRSVRITALTLAYVTAI